MGSESALKGVIHCKHRVQHALQEVKRNLKLEISLLSGQRADLKYESGLNQRIDLDGGRFRQRDRHLLFTGFA